MDQLPDEKTGVVQSNNEIAQTQTVSLKPPKLLILVFSVLVIFGIVVLLFLARSSIQQKISPSPDFSVHLDIPAAADAYSKFIKTAVERSDLRSFSKAFEILKIDYAKNPTIEKRNMLQKLSDYGNQKFEAADLKFKCLDTECIVAVEKVHFKTLRDQINRSELLDEQQISEYNSSIDAAEEAFLENNEDAQYVALSSIFLSLKEISEDGNIEAKNLAQIVLDTMVSINQDKYRNDVANSQIYDL